MQNQNIEKKAYELNLENENNNGFKNENESKKNIT